MTLPELLAELARRDVRLAAEGDRLGLDAPVGAIDPALRRAISPHKATLLGLLSRLPTIAGPPDWQKDFLPGGWLSADFLRRQSLATEQVTEPDAESMKVLPPPPYMREEENKGRDARVYAPTHTHDARTHAHGGRCGAEGFHLSAEPAANRVHGKGLAATESPAESPGGFLLPAWPDQPTPEELAEGAALGRQLDEVRRLEAGPAPGPRAGWAELARQRWGPAAGDPSPGIDVPRPPSRRPKPAAAGPAPGDGGLDGDDDDPSPAEQAEGRSIAAKLDEIRAIESRLAAGAAPEPAAPAGMLAMPGEGRAKG